MRTKKFIHGYNHLFRRNVGVSPDPLGPFPVRGRLLATHSLCTLHIRLFLHYLYSYRAKSHQKERGSLIFEMCSSDVSRRVTSAAQQVQSGKFERGGREVKISIDQQDGITRHHQDCNPIPLLGSWYIQHRRFPQDFDSLHVNKM